MLLDPLEEQLDMPTILVERTDGGRRECHLIGEEDERLAGLGILESNAAQLRGIVLLGVEAIELDGLIADHPGAAIGLRGVDAMKVHVRLGSRDEECAVRLQPFAGWDAL